MKCSRCGAELENGVLFCRECGAKVATGQNRYCRECGAKLVEGVKFCSECGAKAEIPTFFNERPDQKENSDNSSTQRDMDLIERKKKTGVSKTAVLTDTDRNIKNSSSPKINKPALQKKKRSKVPIIIAAVAVLVISSVMWTLVSSSASDSNAPQKNIPRNVDPVTTEEPKIAMVNVLNMAYPAALNILQSAGFTNITSNVDPNSDESLWVVTEQGISVGKSIKHDEKIVLTCAQRCKLYLDIRSEANMMFNTYDISITLDGVEIGSVANGKGFTYLKEVVSGEHTLVFCKSGSSSPKATKKFLVPADMTFSCELGHSGSSIDIKNESKADNIGGASLKVEDVTGMVLSEALSKLNGIGFSNVREEPFTSIWNKNNWIVVTQSLAVGSVVDKNEFFQLDCISLDDYFSKAYVGKNINEIQAHAKENGFSIRFEDESWSDLSSKVASMSDAQKNDWIATKARQYIGSDKTATVTIRNPKEVTPTPTRIPTPTRRPTTSVSEAKNSSVSYSTNDKSTVKNGDSGVYAYRNRGNSYYVYYIIDFDEGYVYRFLDGNGDESCEKVKIQSGNLNDVLIITYNEGGYKYSNGLHFKWKNQPDHLILQDDDGFDWDFYTTDLNDALKIRNKKNIIEY